MERRKFLKHTGHTNSDDLAIDPSQGNSRNQFIDDRFTGKDYYDITGVSIEGNWLQLKTKRNGHLHFKGVKIGQREDLSPNHCYYNHDSFIWFTDEDNCLWRVIDGQAGYWYPRCLNIENLGGKDLLYADVCSWD